MLDASKSFVGRPPPHVDRTYLLVPTNPLPVNVTVRASLSDASKAAALEACGVEVFRVLGGGRDLAAVLEELSRREIQGLLVEGGSRVAGEFLRQGLVNKASFLIAPLILGGDALAAVGGEGAPTVAEATRLRDIETRRHGDDVEITGYVISDE